VSQNGFIPLGVLEKANGKGNREQVPVTKPEVEVGVPLAGD